MGITELIAAGKEFGIFEFYLPFILMFAILFTMLQRIKIFGDPEKGGKGINIIISLAASVFVMAYTPVGISLAQFFANLFGQTLVVILSLFVFIVVVTVVSGLGIDIPAAFKRKGVAWLLVLGVIGLAVGVFFSSGGAAFFPGLKIPGLTLPSIPGVSAQTLAIIIVVVVTGVIIWLLVREPKAAGGKPV